MQKWFLTWRPEAWLWSIRSGLWHSNLSIWINWSILQKDLFLGACPYTHYEGEVVSRHKVTNMQLGSNSSLHFYSQRDCLKCVTHAWDVSQLVLWESPLCAPGNSTSGPALCKASGILLSLSIDLCNGPTCRELSTGSWPIHTHSCGIMMKCTYSPSCPKLCRFIFTDAFLTLYLRQNDVQALFSSQLICVFSYLLTKDSSPEIFASAKRYWHSKIPSFFFFFSDSLFFFFFDFVLIIDFTYFYFEYVSAGRMFLFTAVRLNCQNCFLGPLSGSLLLRKRFFLSLWGQFAF